MADRQSDTAVTVPPQQDVMLSDTVETTSRHHDRPRPFMAVPGYVSRQKALGYYRLVRVATKIRRYKQVIGLCAYTDGR
jgi:hypothetical protein